MKLCVSLLICVGFLVFMNVASAENSSTSLKNASEAELLKLTQENPNEALHFFNLGVLQHKKKDYINAFKNYDRVISLKSPLAPVASYYKAKIYEANGKIDYAKQTLSSIKLADVPESFRKTIISYKNKLFADRAVDDDALQSMMGGSDTGSSSKEKEVEPEEQKLFVYLEASRGQNSNPLYTTTSTSSSSSSIASDHQMQYRASLGYLLSANSVYDLKGNYYFSATRYSAETSSNYLSHDLTTPFSYYFNYTRLKITPEYMRDTYGGATYSQSYGGSADYSFKIGQANLSVSALYMKIKNLTTDYSYLSGNQKRYAVTYDKRWANSRASLGVSLSDYSYEDSSSTASSYRYYATSLSYTPYLGNFDIPVSIGYGAKAYKVKSSSQTDLRNDKRLSFSAQLGYSFKRYYRVFFEYVSLKNDSNLTTSSTSYDYTQSISSLGLSYSF